MRCFFHVMIINLSTFSDNEMETHFYQDWTDERMNRDECVVFLYCSREPHNLFVSLS